MSASKLKLIDPHVHMVSRTTADYQAMAEAGIVAVIEPSFWVGQPRTQAGTFLDYFSSLVGWERFRASQFGIRHYCTIGLNSKEANNEALAEQVMDLIPRFAGKEGVVAIGEIGFDEMTPLEEKYFRLQLEMAVPKTARLMLDSGIAREDVSAVCYGNALSAYGQCGQMNESDWLDPASPQGPANYAGNGVARGESAS